MHLDENFNLLLEEFIIPLSPGNLGTLNLNKFTVGNYDFWFDLPLSSLINVNRDNLFNITYNINTVPINDTKGKQLQKVNNSIKKANYTIVDRILDIQSSVTYKFVDNTPTEEIKLQSFKKPIKVYYDLSAFELTASEISNLIGVYFKPIRNGDFEVVKLKGSYDQQKNIFSFYTSNVGIHSVAILNNTSSNIEKINKDENITINDEASESISEQNLDNEEQIVIEDEICDNNSSDSIEEVDLKNEDYINEVIEEQEVKTTTSLKPLLLGTFIIGFLFLTIFSSINIKWQKKL